MGQLRRGGMEEYQLRGQELRPRAAAEATQEENDRPRGAEPSLDCRLRRHRPQRCRGRGRTRTRTRYIRCVQGGFKPSKENREENNEWQEIVQEMKVLNCFDFAM